jgi:hypothetical protein
VKGRRGDARLGPRRDPCSSGGGAGGCLPRGRGRGPVAWGSPLRLGRLGQNGLCEEEEPDDGAGETPSK